MLAGSGGAAGWPWDVRGGGWYGAAGRHGLAWPVRDRVAGGALRCASSAAYGVLRITALRSPK
ncbi:hypothetical protein NH8B_1975 [Pseudogulbenkiania sp. NH8B]|nr:hypothetical protein NH8B_1975 [Pseudogulbenkiania sp. NH8B]